MSTESHVSPDFGTGEKNLPIYALGIFLCLILTIIPFAAIQYAGYSYAKNAAHIYVCAFVQFIVQVICFLRLNYTTPQAKLNLWSFVFSLLITAVVIAGSLWIMWNLNYNMVH